MEGNVLPSVDEEILADTTRGDADPDPGDVVIVVTGRLSGHPRQHPGVHPVVLVQELVLALRRIDASERLPDVAALRQIAGDLLELPGCEKRVVGNEITERRERRREER